jgi:hypothetical protein
MFNDSFNSNIISCQDFPITHSLSASYAYQENVHPCASICVVPGCFQHPFIGGYVAPGCFRFALRVLGAPPPLPAAPWGAGHPVFRLRNLPVTYYLCPLLTCNVLILLHLCM